MADDMKLKAELRTAFGKGAARKIRAQNKIPAVIYGHGTEPQHVTLPGHETMLLIRKANAVFELDIEGKPELALVKDVQRDPVRQIIEHLDLIVVVKGEKVSVEVPVHIEGESYPGTIHVSSLNTVRLEVEATNIPENVVVSIQGLEEGTQVHASDITLPAGATLAEDSDLLIVSIMVPSAAATEEAAPVVATEESAG
ncbi:MULTISPECIES: 50S ribosomal protein L25/general stress protein Ctc [unclassified Salinibacterium]|uniref:50S ribosomal protein L25/general stress protein Ctc n=1 Tax=unclassified Salinibacterium TaxID=2632331 RepID=UPI0014223283|nr:MULTISPECIES: 50S ribosomal protein L25/general stress protein Ctc [unclassified Salinibacterium]